MYKMHLSLTDLFIILNYVIIFTFLEFSFCVPVLSQKDDLLTQRTDIAYEILRTRSCKDLLVSNSNCTELKNNVKSKMNVYIAEAKSPSDTLKVRAVSSRKVTRKGLNAVLVIDPLPDAHYGHGIIIFFIKRGLTEKVCRDRKNGEYYESDGISECMYIPSKRLCQYTNRRQHRNGGCSFQFFPKVFSSSNPRKNVLKCLSSFNGFGKCPLNNNDYTNICKNMGLCVENVTKSKKCFFKCDHAVMVSGGWDKFINRYRHYLNVRDMWRHLNGKRGYRYGNIKVFFANNATVDLDGNPKTIETEPASESVKIINHIKYVCTKRTRCVDTLTLYLNGPTFRNGDMLLWDSNKDGQAKDLEILKIDTLLDGISTCGAQNIVILADQNYGGHIIEKVESLRKNNAQFDKVHVMTASSKKTLSYNRHFTKGFIDYDDVYIDERKPTVSARPFNLIFKDLKKKLTKFNIRYLPGRNIDDVTITGKSADRVGCTLNIGNG